LEVWISPYKEHIFHYKGGFLDFLNGMIDLLLDFLEGMIKDFFMVTIQTKGKGKMGATPTSLGGQIH